MQPNGAKGTHQPKTTYMRKLILTTILTTTFFISKAQVYFGANAGISLSNFKTTESGINQGFKSSPGYIVAADVNIPISKKILLQTGIAYESYHTKLNATIPLALDGLTVTEFINGSIHLEFINIPLRLVYKAQAGKNFILLGGGPFIGFAVSGNNKVTIKETVTRIDGTVVSEDVTDSNEAIKFGNGDGEVKRINVGLGLNLSYLLQNNLFFSLYSNIGMSNLNNEPGLSSKVNATGFIIGYRFGTKK
jgi:hypothetical protein